MAKTPDTSEPPFKRPAGRSENKKNKTGMGWGGPASGIPARGQAPAFEKGNKAAAGKRDPVKTERNRRRRQAKADRIVRLTHHLEDLAYEAETEGIRLAATVAALNRLEGLPVATQRNLNVETTLADMVKDAAKLRKITTFG
jgi:hypothetical protein